MGPAPKLAAALLALCACGDAADSPTRHVAPGTEHVAATAILGADGAVVARGWARGPVFEFSRAAVPEARADRVREWDFYAIHARGFALMVTLAEVRFEGRGHFVIASVTLHDFVANASHGGSLLLPESDPELLDLAPVAGGNYRVELSGQHLAYEGGPAGRVIDFALDRVVGTPRGGRITGRIEITIADDESIALVTPWAEPGYFFYENKVMAMPVSGSVTVSADDTDKVYELPAEAFAVMDWVRGVVPATIDWTWAVGGGVIGDRRVGLNFGSVFGDEREGTPDAVLVDGVLHKLPPVAWDETDADGGWRLTSEDGRVDLRLLPNGFREVQDLDLGFYVSTLDKPYGTWWGTVELDDGERLVIDGLVGAAERVHTEW